MHFLLSPEPEELLLSIERQISAGPGLLLPVLVSSDPLLVLDLRSILVNAWDIY